MTAEYNSASVFPSSLDAPLALTLDVGTSSTRALLWDLTGREIDGVRAQVKYRMHTTPEGGVEMPAEELERYVGQCVDQALTQAGERAGAIRVVGMSTFWHSMLGLDASGAPITPIYNWADTRPGGAARRLRSTLDEAAIHARTGCMLHASYYPARLTWLRETQPDLFHRVVRWASPSEFLFGRWFGAPSRRVSVSMASGTGLLNQATSVWDHETLSALGIPIETLAPIVDLSECSQGLQGDYIARWPALRSVPFFPAVGDGACGNVGSGCISPERIAINLGTSGAIRVLWDETSPHALAAANDSGQGFEAPMGLWRYRVDRQRPLLGAAFSDGGVVYEWMLRTLQLPPPDQLEAKLASLPPDDTGELTFLPFLAGERSLGWNPDARAALIGMNLNTDPLMILRASLEAVALRFGLAARHLRERFPQAHEIVASGGALGASPVWSQMFADALGQTLTLAAEPEASSRGAALLSLEAAGLIKSSAEASARLGVTFTPDPQRQAIYAQRLERQQQLYETLIDKNHEDHDDNLKR